MLNQNCDAANNTCSIPMATKAFLLLLFFFLITGDIVPCDAGAGAGSKELMRACSVTSYRSLCVHTLAVFRRVRGPHGPYLWARAAVSVALAESERASRYASSLHRSLPRGAAAEGAVHDCAECLSNAVDELRSSLEELRRLQQPRTGAFASQMSDLQTWVSAAFTDQDTCLEGLADLGSPAPAPAPALRGLEAKVLNTTYLCSNALALINRLATSNGLP